MNMQPGVTLSLDDARYLLEALGQFAQLAGAHGGALSPRLAALTENLETVTNASETQANTTSNARFPWLQPDWGNHGAHGTTITPAEAAGILGCTSANARDLAERGTIPASKVGGRWRLDRAAVVARSRHD